MSSYTAPLLPLLLIVAFASAATGQQIPACASSLISCAGYLNSTTTPPASCCTPLKEAVKTQAPCLCSLFNDTSLLKTYSIDLKQVLRLPKACGVSANQTTLCAAAAAAAAPTSGSTPSSSSTPATPKSTNSNSAHGTVWIGFPGLMAVFLFVWSIAT